MKLLEVADLRVAIEGREILHGANLVVDAGETVVLIGKNGAGKSTLGAAVMGTLGGAQTSVGGSVKFRGEELMRLTVDERARRGLFMTWQMPVEIEGVSTLEMLRTVAAAQGRKGSEVEAAAMEACRRLGVDPWSVRRPLNVGFSGGEKKKNELVQMMALSPKLAILDEVDSGLDREAAARASRVLREFQEETGVAYLVVTHNRWILQELVVARRYEVDSGWVEEVVAK